MILSTILSGCYYAWENWDSQRLNYLTKILSLTMSESSLMVILAYFSLHHLRYLGDSQSSLSYSMRGYPHYARYSLQFSLFLFYKVLSLILKNLRSPWVCWLYKILSKARLISKAVTSIILTMCPAVYCQWPC